MKDARHVKREVVNRFLPISNRESGELIGYLTDLTDRGALVQSNERLPEATVVPLLIDQHEINPEYPALAVDARCVWNRETPNAVFCYSGLEFEAPSPATQDQLRSIRERFRLAQAR